MSITSSQTRAANESVGSAVSWAAIIAGALTSSAFSIVLIALGAGLGLVSISPWSNSGVSATTFGFLAIAWFTAIQLFSSGLGGYIAGRLRANWVGSHTDEVFFRDTAHGLLVWALGTILSAMLLTSAVETVIGGAAQAGGAAVQGVASAASSAVGTAAKGADPTAYFSDMLFRSDKAPDAADASARTEVARIVGKALNEGEMSAPDKSYVAQVISRQTGMSQPDAEKRVNDTITQAKTTAQQAADSAKKVTDAARKVALSAALWAFIALLIGAFSACYMATIGGRLRDDLPAM